MAFLFGLQTLKSIDHIKIYQLKGLEPKIKSSTNFYDCCDLTKKIYLLLGVVNVLSYKVDLAFEEWSYWTESFWTLPPHKWFMIEYWMWRITIFYIKKWNLKKVLKLFLKRWNFYIEGPLCFFKEWNDWFPRLKSKQIQSVMIVISSLTFFNTV